MLQDHIISVTVENKFGVLARIAGLFSSRGYNIKSLSVAETEDPTCSRMTIVVNADEKILEQIKKQLNKLIDTIKVQEFTNTSYLDRELMLIKVNTDPKKRTDLFQIVEVLNGKIINMTRKSITIEITAASDILENVIKMLQPFGIIETVRTGKIAISRDAVD
ncbi:MAG: acetolactate synthase small subunit [Spirochaetes bacterium GWF1_41_5]|nr:MAG: acetolactate synthase small subunit [Spirochaetes bacterium GWF1_41_5]HBE03932.1 acetolactate synthase small subunit [Spirochaetia bacterium]